MNKLFFAVVSILMVTSSYQCNRKAAGSGKLRGKLVIKEICAHYVIQVIEGNVDTSMVTNGWKDEQRNKTYDKVFTVSNRCGFAETNLNEGDEFEFSFDKNPPPEDCLVCMAFYSTPPKRSAVKIMK
jgi:hypothetical protein